MAHVCQLCDQMHAQLRSAPCHCSMLVYCDHGMTSTYFLFTSGTNLQLPRSQLTSTGTCQGQGMPAEHAWLHMHILTTP